MVCMFVAVTVAHLSCHCHWRAMCLWWLSFMFVHRPKRMYLCQYNKVQIETNWWQKDMILRCIGDVLRADLIHRSEMKCRGAVSGWLIIGLLMVAGGRILSRVNSENTLQQSVHKSSKLRGRCLHLWPSSKCLLPSICLCRDINITTAQQ